MFQRRRRTCAARTASRSSPWPPRSWPWPTPASTGPIGDPERFGVMLGSGIGGLKTLEDQHTILMNKGPSRISPFMIPMMISQHGQRHRLDGVRPAGAELRHRLRLRHLRPFHRRSVAHDPRWRRRCLPRRRLARRAIVPLGIGGFARHEGALHAQRRAARRRRARGTRIATASSWAKARASSCWKELEHAQDARRAHLRRDRRLRPHGRCLSHELAAAESRAGPAQHAHGAEHAPA